jgi:asparagine synthase (glutamine-hydrolysing)
MMGRMARSFLMGEIVAVLDKKGQGATEKAVKMLEVLAPKNPNAYGIATPSTVRIEISINALQRVHTEKTRVALGCVFSKILPNDKPQLTKLNEAIMVFEGRIYPSTTCMSNMEVAASKLYPCSEKTVEAFIREVEGDFTFAIAKPQMIIAGRDSVGVQPLYYGENAIFAALASARKALWKIGIEKVCSFPPGHLAHINEEGFRFKPVKVLSYSKPAQMATAFAVKKLEDLLKSSVKTRVCGLKEVAVAFSGGIDSSLIAFLAKKSGVDVHLIHVSLKNQPETKHAQMVAEKLKLPLHVCLFNESDVEKTLPKVVWLVEEADVTKLSIGIPIYWVAEKAAEMGLKVLLAGQGADELFGGYKRYVNYYLCEDGDGVYRKMFTDILRLHEDNIERDVKICKFHGVELRLPFATYEMAMFAACLPIEFKIERRQDALRKIILRRVAENFGCPKCIFEYPKRAMQYATGVDKAIKKLSKKKGMCVKEYLNNVFQKVIKRPKDAYIQFVWRSIGNGPQ